MKQLSIFISLLFAVVCCYGLIRAVPCASAQDTLPRQRYVIDNKMVQQFDGSQLEGKKIVSYRISTINAPSKGVIWVHDIHTDAAVQSGEPIYVIDGKKVSKRKFENLSPSRIKSMTIVKNGSIPEVKQYPGWENGVILVETNSYTTETNLYDDITGSVSVVYPDSNPSTSARTVKSDDKVAYRDMYDFLRGRVAGVFVDTDGSIKIRGLNSMNASTEPLILLDGMVISDLSTINPQDVYSVKVLKGPETAIYGIRGANGVILITTKLGQQAKEQKAAAERKARQDARAARKKR